MEQHRILNKEIRDIVLSPKYCLPFLQPGRLVSLQCISSDEDVAPLLIEDQVTWGLVINFERVKSFSEGENLYLLIMGIHTFILRCYSVNWKFET